MEPSAFIRHIGGIQLPLDTFFTKSGIGIGIGTGHFLISQLINIPGLSQMSKILLLRCA
jgi:hypothetical protein